MLIILMLEKWLIDKLEKDGPRIITLTVTDPDTNNVCFKYETCRTGVHEKALLLKHALLKPVPVLSVYTYSPYCPSKGTTCTYESTDGVTFIINDAATNTITTKTAYQLGSLHRAEIDAIIDQFISRARKLEVGLPALDIVPQTIKQHFRAN